jgi:hypothetical protein
MPDTCRKVIVKHWFSLFVIFAVSYVLVWAYWHHRFPLTAVSYTARQSSVVRGDDLYIDYVIEVREQCQAKIQRAIIDAAGTRFPVDDREFRFTASPGETKYTVVRRVPMIATPGPAMYRVAAIYHCTLFDLVWPLVDIRPDLKFTILDRPFTLLPENKLIEPIPPAPLPPSVTRVP